MHGTHNYNNNETTAKTDQHKYLITLTFDMLVSLNSE